VTLSEFRSSLIFLRPPDVSDGLLALWYDARGDWKTAHRIAQDINTPAGAWIHAYLHRKEGDLGNAAYWYQRASQPVATDTLNSEWATIAEELLRSA
jgi:hypothetical protein